MPESSKLIEQWEVAVFSQPESVLALPDHDWLYVSNVSGTNNGYISRVSKDGAVDSYQWVTGLGSPTGMGLFDGILYVADQNWLHMIDVVSGKRLKSIIATEAKSLNDVTISEDGQVFISDIFGGKIYVLENDTLDVWLDTPEIAYPNGLLIWNNNLIIANFGTTLEKDLSPEKYGSLYRVNINDKSVSLIPTSYQLGRLDGITAINNGLVASHHPAGELYFITDKERVLLGHIADGLADIGSDSRLNTLYAPLMLDDKIIAYKINTK
ncbi:MAG: hypothetical protein EOL87_17065 [Spartobacteria bacterium]|nr:hypothetical protein [Spartobacteria bacterium]